jgi:hypothetical protein
MAMDIRTMATVMDTLIITATDTRAIMRATIAHGVGAGGGRSIPC